jgi:hypothetical protein
MARVDVLSPECEDALIGLFMQFEGHGDSSFWRAAAAARLGGLRLLGEKHRSSEAATTSLLTACQVNNAAEA